MNKHEHQRWRPMLPYQPCLGCCQGDASRVVFVVGDANWLAAALRAYLKLPMDEAIATAEVAYEEHGADLDERHQHAIRVCRNCANRSGLPIYSAARFTRGELDVIHGCVQEEA